MGARQVLITVMATVVAAQPGCHDSGGDRPPADGGRDSERDVTAPDAQAEAESGGGGAAGFDDVEAVFEGRCTICHDAQKRGLPAYWQLDLTPAAAYDALVGKPATEPCGGVLVAPGDAAHSYLYRKLVDDAPCDGVRMPRPFEVGIAPPLDAATLAMIRRWIDQGAAR